MGLVTDALVGLLWKQIEAHCTLVWYDPEHAYLDVARSLTPENLSGAAVYCYEPERGFLWLRRQLEPLWAERTDPPRLLLYVPLGQAEAENALIEYEIAGAVLRPDQQPPELNTALAAIARQGLSTVVPAARLEEIVGQIEAGHLSLAELDALAEKGVEALTGVIATLFGSGNPQEVALRFLSDPSLDAEIEARQALASLASLFSEALGVSFVPGLGTAALRARVARQVLVTELLEAVGKKAPPALSTFGLASNAVARQTAAQLARTWRYRRDLAGSYAHWAGQVQAEIGPGSLDLDLEALARTETFVVGEIRLQGEVEKALAHRASVSLVDLAESRQAGFWSTQQPEIKTRWEVVADAGRVLVEAARIEDGLKGKSWTAAALLSHYAYGKSSPKGGDGPSGAHRPWCELDTAQRHLERDYHRFDLDPEQHQSLIKLVALARQRYAAVADRLADLFTRAYATDEFVLPGVLLQADIFRETVALAAKDGRVAYILVDALRFEMARELLGILDAAHGPEYGEGWTHELTPALATPPTITEVGMAALLPGAERGLSLGEVGGKLAPAVGGQTLRTRQERVAYLETAGLGALVVTKLDQLAPLSDTHLSQAVKGANLIVVTATEEIDGLCENNPALARRTLDDVLNQLRRGLKTLFGLGVQTAVITADHGYLFGEKITSGQGIDAPGGKTITLKRRVWIGKGGAKLPGTLRAPLSALGVGGDLEMATPWNLSCFKVKGGRTEYFHGGLSLPELVIPVLTVRSEAGAGPTAAAPVQWTLTVGGHSISTRFVSITVNGRSAQLLPIQPPVVRVEVRAKEQSVSVPVSAKYGFQEATRDVQLMVEAGGPPQAIAENTITLMITEELEVKDVTVHLLDATTGISLTRLEHVPVTISL
ncbi:MAG: PglZ domain-containing protein [Chloroflexota bacterium]